MPLLSRCAVTLNRVPQHGPVITVEDTGSQLRIKSSITDSLIDSNKASLDNATVVLCESNGSGTHPTASRFKRHNSRLVKIVSACKFNVINYQ
ncbi:hypothetical protein DICVIV_07018 [Dictyocaulus viviparus]|uniref:Uncharacterized protein n=1 Tax=Dictyocaulus viviparus TaxID=29172 RepID=A0A0D8XQL1_DICVI|nr:hypothetical protein DICVIV_07018 [Dictyocaulus viviparus]